MKLVAVGRTRPVVLFAVAAALCASCTPPSDSAGGGSVLSIELFEGASGKGRAVIRVSFRNTTDREMSFTEPRLVHPDIFGHPMGGDAPVLALVVRDEKGREPDPFILSHPKESPPPPPPSTTLRPGETWSWDYPFSSFYVWGPCGPAVDLGSALTPGESSVEVSAVLHIGPDESVLAAPIRVSGALPEFLFAHLSISVAEVDETMSLVAEADRSTGPPPTPIADLVPLIADADPRVRALVAAEFKRRGAESAPAVPALVRMLEVSAEPADRLMAAHALAGVGPGASGAVPALTAALEDEEVRVREVAAEALRAIEGPTAPAAETVYGGRTVAEWIESLGARGEDIDALVLGRSESVKARRALEQIGHAAVPPLIEALRSDDRAMVMGAESALAGILRGDERSAEAVIALLESDDVRLRRAAARILGGGRFGGFGPIPPRSVEALLGALDDADAEVAGAAADGLGRPGLASAVEPLRSALRHQEPDVRARAARSLGEIGPMARGCKAALEALLRDPALPVREDAARALEALGFRRYVEFEDRLEVLYGGGQSEVRSVDAGAVAARLPTDADGVIFIVDRSGTGGDTFAAAKRIVSTAVERFADDVRFGIVFFDREVITFPAEFRPARARAASKEAARRFIEEMPAGDGSCLFEGLLAVLRFLNGSRAERNAVVYIGPGEDACPGSGSGRRKSTVELFTAANAGRAELHALGLGIEPGSGPAELFLRHLAAENGGEYTRVTP